MMFIYDMFITVYMFFKSFVATKDYTIRRVEMTYAAPPCPLVKYSDFWRSEARYWDSKEGSHNWTIIPKNADDMGETPDGVEDRVFTVKYYYDGKKYHMVTKDPEYVWPPPEPPAAFRVPVFSAILASKDKPVRNVTKKLLKAMGPRRDFHGQDVPIEDLFTFDDYTDIYVKDITGNVKNAHRTTSCLSLL